MSTSEGLGVNRHTARCTNSTTPPVSVLWQAVIQPSFIPQMLGVGNHSPHRIRLRCADFRATAKERCDPSTKETNGKENTRKTQLKLLQCHPEYNAQGDRKKTKNTTGASTVHILSFDIIQAGFRLQLKICHEVLLFRFVAWRVSV